MPESVQGEYGEGPVYIRKKGVWDMQDLYEAMADFFRQRKYRLHERVYKHKRPSPFGAERQYTWEAEKEETDFLKFSYEIYIHTYDAHDVEVVDKQNKKRTFTKGRIWIQLKAAIESDWDKRFTGSSLYEELKKFLYKYVIKDNIVMGYETKLKYEMYELHAMIKNRLKMESDEFEFQHFSGMHRKF